MTSNFGKNLTIKYTDPSSMANRRDEVEVGIPLQPPTPSSPTEEYYRSIFDRADKNKDGIITLQELNEMIHTNNLTDEPLPPNVLRRVYQMADTNRDSILDYDEFVKMINNPGLKHIFGRYVNNYIRYVVPIKRRRLGAEVDTVDGKYYEDEYSCKPPSLGMILISIVEFIFFMIDECNEKNSTKTATGPMAQIFIYDPSKRYQAWRYLTYMFVHIGYVHLTVNIAVQIFIGTPLEMVHGWWRVLVIYFTGVVAGSLGTSITDPYSKLAGASGGVYSLITAHIATIILNWSEMSFPGVQLCIFLIITCVDVGTSIYNRYWAGLDENIGYVAHFAGAIAGLLVGISVLRNLKVKKKENIIWWIAIVLYAVLMLIAIGWNIFYTDYFPASL